MIGIAWWDEHHKECILGPSAKIETLVCVDGNGVPTTPDDGGLFPQKKTERQQSILQKQEDALALLCSKEMTATIVG